MNEQILKNFKLKGDSDLYADLIKVLDLNKKDTTKLMKFNVEEKEQGDDYWWMDIKMLTPGQSFGELALLNDAPRAATIRCNQECYFATIQREEWEKVLKRIELKT